jgi:hypothetical protein
MVRGFLHVRRSGPPAAGRPAGPLGCACRRPGRRLGRCQPTGLGLQLLQRPLALQSMQRSCSASAAVRACRAVAAGQLSDLRLGRLIYDPTPLHRPCLACYQRSPIRGDSRKRGTTWTWYLGTVGTRSTRPAGQSGTFETALGPFWTSFWTSRPGEQRQEETRTGEEPCSGGVSEPGLEPGCPCGH